MGAAASVGRAGGGACPQLVSPTAASPAAVGPVVVVDASLTIKWFYPEPDSPAARRLLDSWQAAAAIIAAPYTLSTETTNGLFRKGWANRRELGELVANAIAFLNRNVQFHPDAALYGRGAELALELNQRNYHDSHYLALAERLSCDMWTADAPFYEAAARRGYRRVRLLSEFAG